jgi:hypothetical protein
MVAGAVAIAIGAIRAMAASAAHGVVGAVVAGGAAVEGGHLFAYFRMGACRAVEVFTGAAHTDQFFEDGVALLTFELIKWHD